FALTQKDQKVKAGNLSGPLCLWALNFTAVRLRSSASLLSEILRALQAVGPRLQLPRPFLLRRCPCSRTLPTKQSNSPTRGYGFPAVVPLSFLMKYNLSQVLGDST